jgi:hypothetical protein
MIIKTQYIVIAILSLYSIFTTYKIISDKPQIVTNIVTIPGDIVYKDKIIYQPKPYKVEIPVHDTTYIPMDSAQCVADYKELWKKYNTINQGLDTLQNDTSMSIIVGTKIFQNTLEELRVSSKNNRVRIINNTIVTYKNKLPMLSVGGLYDMKSLTAYGELRVNPNLYLNAGYNLTIKSPVIGIKYTIFNK